VLSVKRQPLVVWLVAALAAGILLRGWVQAPLLVPAVTAAAAAVILPLASTRPCARVAAAACLFAALGTLLCSLALRSVREAPLAGLAATESFVSCEGQVVSDPIKETGGRSFLFRVRNISGSGGIRTDEVARVTLRGGDERSLFLGDRLSISGRARPAGEDDSYRQAMLRKGLACRLTTYPETSRLLPAQGHLLPALYGFRRRVSAAISRSMKRDEAAVLGGILLGDRSLIRPELTEDFSRSGLAHVLAVSGLHVGLMAALAIGVCRALHLGPRARSFLLLSTVAGYVALTGVHASALRSGTMIAVALLAWVIGREREILASVSLAALVMLVYDPLYAFDVGCQLSFGAVVSLAVLSPRLEPYLSALPERIRQGVSPALSVQLGLAPLLAAYFQQVSIVAPLANLVVVPVTGLALGTGMAAAILHGTLGLQAPLLFAPAALFIRYIAGAATFFAGLPLAALAAPSPDVWGACLYYLALWWILIRTTSAAFSPWPGLAGVLALTLLVVWPRLDPPAPFARERLVASFLDVGQGDAVLLRTRRECVLVDGGPAPAPLVSALAKKRVDRLDVLAITHEHADHTGGLERLARRVRVGTVLLPRHIRADGLLRRVLASLKSRGARLRRVQAGYRVGFEDGLRLDVLHPGREPVEETQSRANDNSLVLRATFGSFSLLLTGDVEVEAERRLLKRPRALDVDLLKVPHHGSSRGLGARLLRAASPSLAVISVGEGNHFGHPAPSTLRRLRRFRIRVLRTDRQGTIDVTSDGEKVYY